VQFFAIRAGHTLGLNVDVVAVGQKMIDNAIVQAYTYLDKLDRKQFMDWQVAEAKNKFSELMQRALTEGPQRVRGRKNAVIMLAEEEYERLTGKRPDFKEYLMVGPSFDDLDLSRDASLGRDVPL
jgi:prevent-host-death family protein